MSDIPEAVARVSQRMPEKGFMGGKSWVISPEPFPLSRSQVAEFERLGELLRKFISACDEAFRRSRRGSLPGWIAEYLQKGKPEFLVRLAEAPALSPALPPVIRPDVLLTEGGFVLSELDSVPGGIGVTDFLQQCYQGLGWELVGGDSGMRDGFANLFPEGADIVLSEESSDYRSEMEWLVASLEKDQFRICDAETYQPECGRSIYRFFELFDHENIPFLRRCEKELASGALEMVSPPQVHLEEKMWFALFHRPALRDFWRRALRGSGYQQLLEHLPYSWMMDPSPVPHHTVIPRLEYSCWEDLARVGRRERELVLKVSGFSEDAWGSRGVWMGHDMSQDRWAEAIKASLERFEHSPCILQEFHQPRRVVHPIWNEVSGKIEPMEGRVRLCPYYFVSGGRTRLSGVLATIVPADKKIVHGMEVATLVPCSVVD